MLASGDDGASNKPSSRLFEHVDSSSIGRNNSKSGEEAAKYISNPGLLYFVVPHKGKRQKHQDFAIVSLNFIFYLSCHCVRLGQFLVVRTTVMIHSFGIGCLFMNFHILSGLEQTRHRIG